MARYLSSFFFSLSWILSNLLFVSVDDGCFFFQDPKVISKTTGSLTWEASKLADKNTAGLVQVAVEVTEKCRCDAVQRYVRWASMSCQKRTSRLSHRPRYGVSATSNRFKRVCHMLARAYTWSRKAYLNDRMAPARRWSPSRSEGR